MDVDDYRGMDTTNLRRASWRHNTFGETIVCVLSLNYYKESNVGSAGDQLHKPSYIVIANADEVYILLGNRSSYRVREPLRTSR